MNAHCFFLLSRVLQARYDGGLSKSSLSYALPGEEMVVQLCVGFLPASLHDKPRGVYLSFLIWTIHTLLVCVQGKLSSARA